MIKLLKTILEDLGLFVVFHVSVSFPQFLIVFQMNFENISDTCVVCKHHATHFVRSLNVGTLLGESHLDRSRAPGNEVSQLSLPDSLKTLVNLSGVYFSLDDV